MARHLAAAAGHRGDALTRLTAALRHPPTPEGMRADALAASDRRAAHILAGGPWSDPATRDVGTIAGDMHAERMVLVAVRDARAQAARAEANVARGRIGFLDRLVSALGIRTAAVRDADEADIRAFQAEADRDGGQNLREVLGRLDGHARTTARGREAERSVWSQRPEVAAARRELHGNDLVRVAAASGDMRIAHLAVVDLTAARELLLRYEAEEVSRREQASRRQAAAISHAVSREVPCDPRREASASYGNPGR